VAGGDGGDDQQIAHQWRQPLNMLGLLIQELLITKKRREMTDEKL
jgi:hypothetical protein